VPAGYVENDGDQEDPRKRCFAALSERAALARDEPGSEARSARRGQTGAPSTLEVPGAVAWAGKDEISFALAHEAVHVARNDATTSALLPPAAMVGFHSLLGTTIARAAPRLPPSAGAAVAATLAVVAALAGSTALSRRQERRADAGAASLGFASGGVRAFRRALSLAEVRRLLLSGSAHPVVDRCADGAEPAPKFQIRSSDAHFLDGGWFPPPRGAHDPRYRWREALRAFADDPQHPPLEERLRSMEAADATTSAGPRGGAPPSPAKCPPRRFSTALQLACRRHRVIRSSTSGRLVGVARANTSAQAHAEESE
jgi:hypothetical protein